MYPDERYKHDVVFNRVVDQMRVMLRMYQITPSELREAVILASTMHMNENISPLYTPFSSLALFGVANAIASNAPLRTAAGSALDFETYDDSTLRFSSLNPKEVYPQTLERRNLKAVADRRDHSHTFRNNTRYKWERRQGDYTDLGRADKTGDRRKSPFHTYGVEQGQLQRFRVCTRCGLSDVYVTDTPSALTCSGKLDLRN